MLTAVWHMLSDGTTYRDLGTDYYTRQTPQRELRRKIAALEAAGYTVVPTAA